MTECQTAACLLIVINLDEDKKDMRMVVPTRTRWNVCQPCLRTIGGRHKNV